MLKNEGAKTYETQKTKESVFFETKEKLSVAWKEERTSAEAEFPFSSLLHVHRRKKSGAVGR